MRKVTRWILIIGAILLGSVNPSLQADARPRPVKSAGELQLALQKLTVLGSALYIAAHPDDENTAALAYLANHRLVRSAYLSLTRGDGGQNLLGSEKGALLGVLRTQELLAARRIDGAEQFFSRAVDFGYSKSAEETLEIWGKEAILADVVWVIRRFRPDIIMTRFTPQLGNHGQHLASAILAEEAFQAAGDSTRFPEQLAQVQPWQAKRLFWNAWKPALQGKDPDSLNLLGIDVGEYNPLLGESYTEIAAKSRSMHKCQGFGTSARRGSYREFFQLTAGDSAEKDLFEGIDLTWSRVEGGAAVGAVLQEAAAAFDPLNPPASVPKLLEAYRLLEQLPKSYWVRHKQRALRSAIRDCLGLWIAARAEHPTVSRAGQIPVAIQIINRSNFPVALAALRLPFAERDSSLKTPLSYNQPLEISVDLPVAARAAVSLPFWLREPAAEGRYAVSEPSLIGIPEQPALPPLRLTLEIGGEKLDYEAPLLYHGTDPVDGEKYRSLDIAPPLTLNFENDLTVFPDAQPQTVRLILKSGRGAISGQLKLLSPPGWSVSPAELTVSFSESESEVIREVTIRPPATPMTRTLIAEVIMEDQGQPARSLVRIDYPHIPLQTLFPRAEMSLVRTRLQKRGEHIGYIIGSGDEIPQALEQVGYRVTLLSDAELESRNLQEFDAIITGVRAYNTRHRLKHAQKRLLKYVENGGTLLVQYNVSYGLVIEELGPYPFTISRDRVTRENAPLEFLDYQHPVFSTPNRILQRDFQGWVQERGLYFASDWDSRYTPLLSSRDPGESPKRGGLLLARYGKGYYFYTGYAFFRQLPAGVPGAYKLFVNMLSIGRQP